MKCAVADLDIGDSNWALRSIKNAVGPLTYKPLKKQKMDCFAVLEPAARGTANPALMSVIREHEAATMAWLATSDGDLPVDTMEEKAADQVEEKLIHFPCHSHADVLAKVGYLYQRTTEAARAVHNTIQTDFLDEFLGSLIGIGQGDALPATATPPEHPWVKARRLSKDLSETLKECGGADWFAHVLPSDLKPNVFFGALPMGLKPDELPVDHINRLAWELSDALNRWNGGGYQAMVLPSERGGNTVMFTNVRAWDGRAAIGEAPDITLMTGFSEPIPGVDEIEDLFHRWKDAEARENAADSDEAADAVHVEYNALQNLIAKQTPQTARELAMLILAYTDRWAADITDELRKIIDTLAGEKEGV